MTSKETRAGGGGGADDGVAPAVRRTLAIVSLLAAHRRRLGQASLAGLLAGIVVAALLPVRFSSTARFVPEKPSSSSLMSKMGGLADLQDAGLSSDLLGVKSNTALYTAVLQSRTVQDRMVERFGLMRLYHCWYREQARQKLASRTSLAEDRKSNVVTLVVTDGDPERAAAMARGYLEEMNRVLASVNMSGAHRERLFVEERLKSVRRDLDEAEQRLSVFSSQNATIDIGVQGRAMVEGVATVKAQLIAGEAELRGLEQIYGRENGRVQAARARVAELEAQMKRLGASGGDEFYPALRQLPLLGVAYVNLAREVRIQDLVYQMLTKQYEAARIDEAKDLPSISVIDEGEVPENTGLWQRLGRMLVVLVLTVVATAGWLVAAALSPAVAATAGYVRAAARSAFAGRRRARQEAV